ncbi:translation initiation factor eIF 4e-like domain-containing protein [Schizophyllum commune]
MTTTTMSSYFSNHSQSRFLSNAAQPGAPTPGTPPASSASGVPPPGQRPPVRVPSKHFSTSVAADGTSSASPTTTSATSTNGTPVHPLRTTWVFFFRMRRAPGDKITSYEEGIKRIAAFSSAESFWGLWTHLEPPSKLQPTTDYLLFHQGIRRPVWEDPLNIRGGKWIVRLKKGVADRIWEDLILAIVGDQFDACQAAEGAVEEELRDAPEICGCTISVRQSEDIISLWNKTDGDLKLREKIRDTMRKVLNLPATTIMEYKSNNDSMQDKSSFRNSAIDRTPLS